MRGQSQRSISRIFRTLLNGIPFLRTDSCADSRPGVWLLRFNVTLNTGQSPCMLWQRADCAARSTRFFT